MSELQSLLSVVSFLAVLPDIVILAMSGLYMSRSKRTDAKLLFSGSLIHFLVRIFYFVIPYITVMRYDDGYSDLQTLYFIAGAVSFVGSVLFCTGLVMLIQFVLGKLSQQQV